MRGTTEATEALAEHCRKNEGVVQGNIFLPHIGEVVDVTRESHIFQVIELEDTLFFFIFSNRMEQHDTFILTGFDGPCMGWGGGLGT